MNLLILAGAYPHPGHAFSGAFNEKCTLALRGHCNALEVLAPRPFVPPLLGFHPRWNAYRRIPAYEIRNGIPITRPSVPVIPRIGSAFWLDSGGYFFLRTAARRLHGRAKFDAIMSFDLIDTGGVAWRLGRDLQIPACGWAFGEDVRCPQSSPLAGVVRRAIQNLSCVFYQSHELLQKGRDLLGETMTPEIASRQTVLAHGIPAPPVLANERVRRQVRERLGIAGDEILVLNVSRVTRPKGAVELVEAFSQAIRQNPRLRCVWVGANPGFDESHAIEGRIRATPALQGRFILMPSCAPEQVWEYLCAADIFAFPSHREGMSNSLLEAMAMGLPVVAFAIPANCEVDSGAGVLLMAPPLDVKVFSDHLTSLSVSAELRTRLGKSAANLVEARFRVEKNMQRAVQQIAALIEPNGKRSDALDAKRAVLDSASANRN